MTEVQRAVYVATIANAAALSGAIDLGERTLTNIQMPDSGAWTAAVITFDVSWDNVTYEPLYDANGTERTVQAGADRSIQLSPADYAGIRYLKVRSGTAGSPVNQGAARTLNLTARVVL